MKLNPLKFGLTAGIIGAIITFLSTVTGILGYSNTADIMASSLWSTLGYSVNWMGAFIGLILGFVYGFVLMWVSALIYNKFIS